ncbi:hypothetical protein AB4Y45_27945 [Paraburkholderia sp. EG287A]|uniref:hypothetical protein n=1 Tax=Paraburkholderia sp. EG287A TaxID=3237012 RepID=UPI0034D18709
MSNQHHAALMRNLGGSVEDNSPGQNVAIRIRNSTKDETLDHVAKGNTMGNNCKGAFDRLKAGLRAYERENGSVQSATSAESLTKALREQEGFSGTMHGELDQRVLIAKLKAGPQTKPTAVTLAKAIGKTRGLLKSMGFDGPTGTTSLEATYNSDSTTMTGGDAFRNQSLAGAKPKRRVYSDNELLKAGEDALRCGKISSAEAYHLSSAVAMGKHPGEDVAAKLADYLPKREAQ